LNKSIPAENGHSGQSGFPLRLFAAAFAISLLAAAVGASLSWRLEGRLDELRTRQFQLREYISRVMLFDEVIAQGVQTEAQWLFLAATSPVSKLQGCYYSEPVPAERADELLRRRRIALPAGGREARVAGKATA